MLEDYVYITDLAVLRQRPSQPREIKSPRWMWYWCLNAFQISERKWEMSPKKKKKTSGQSLCVRKTWVMSRKTSNRRGEWFKVYKRQIPGVSQQWFLIQAHVTLCLWGCVSIDLPLRCYKRQASTTEIQPLIIWTTLNVRLVSPAVFETGCVPSSRSSGDFRGTLFSWENLGRLNLEVNVREELSGEPY